MFLVKPDAIPDGAPTSISEIVFYTPQGKPRVCEIQDLSQALNLDLTPQIQETILESQNWELRNSNFNAVIGGKYLIDNISNNREIQLPNNPLVGQEIQFLLLGTNPTIFRVNENKYIGIDLDIRSTVRFGLIQLIYSGSSLGWIPTNPANQSLNGAAHTFVSGGDTNGYFHFAGTNFGAAGWSNPLTAGRIAITTPGPAAGSSFVDRATSILATTGNPLNITFDLITRQIQLERFTFQTAGPANPPPPRFFSILGSNNNADYSVISDFELSDLRNTWRSAITNSTSFYRYIRFSLANNGSWNNNNSICLLEVELYGISRII